ncbi:MAG: cellulase family glycosylhydrolase [Firmicutes bacterium]|nr:cellulase family glycosylhydrolase [Bacillota bacterium]
MPQILIRRGWFEDETHRRLLLRGVNLGGSSKVPAVPDGATYRREGFFAHRDVSFVGRPFPLEEADEHFARLRAWGFNLLRFLVTWEAVEPAGPGLYDAAYLDYLYEVVKKAGEYGFYVFIDPHQDVWSRFSGGDGAPGWTFAAVGLDITRFDETGAAITHQIHGDPFPRMIWPTNNFKLAAATMFTLFFAGNDFAPGLKVDGLPIQEYLQSHYLEAMARVAACLKDLPHVLGYEAMNEPAAGYIGCPDLAAPMGELRIGDCPTPYQSMLLAAGFPQEVEVWELRATGFRRVGRRLLNPGGVRAWLPGRKCIWREHGVWDVAVGGVPRLLRPDYFHRVGGREVDFNRDYYRPFANRFAAAIRAVHPGALIFVEPLPDQPLPEWGPQEAGGIVFAPHWYDAYLLLRKEFIPWLGVDVPRRRLVFGRRAVRRYFAAQVRAIKGEAAGLGGAPTLIGEVGIPFDLGEKGAYRTGDFSRVIEAMDRSLRAMDDVLVSYTIWNYTADNINARGDGWNDEDLSIFSRDQQTDPADLNSGGRALAAVLRPYARATAGEPLKMSFDYRRRRFEFEFCHAPAAAAPTEFFIPNYRYPEGYRVEVSDGGYEKDPENQLLRYYHTLPREKHWVRVRPERS